MFYNMEDRNNPKHILPVCILLPVHVMIFEFNVKFSVHVQNTFRLFGGYINITTLGEIAQSE